MRNFYDYMVDRSLAGQKLRIALLMAERRVDPYLCIQEYLDSDTLLTESWVGSFFKRLGNAWNGFWKNPNPEDSPLTRLEAAQKALGELQQMMQQNQGADQGAIQVVLKGLEQSLAIVSRIEPTVQQLSSQIQQFAQTGVPHSDPNAGLPQDLNGKWMDIMQRRNELMKSASEDNMQKLVANSNEFQQFKVALEQEYQQIDPQDANQANQDKKKRIENWLKRIDTDATFRQIENLLDLARTRTAGGKSAQRPEGVGDVQMAYRQIVAATQDQGQQRQQLIGWYGKLPENHPVKSFVRQEMQNNPQSGADENDMFYQYAHEWMMKFPHHMGS